MRTITVQCNDESVMEPALSKVSHDHPGIYIKSLATTLGVSPELDVILTAAGSDPSVLDAMVSAAMVDLREGLTSLGLVSRLKDAATKPM